MLAAHLEQQKIEGLTESRKKDIAMNWGDETRSKEIGTARPENVDTANLDHRCDPADSFSTLEIENLDEEKMIRSYSHDNIETHEHAAEIEYKIIEPECLCPVVECSLIPVATAYLKDETVCLASAADESKTSSDGPPSDNCFSDWDLGANRVGIIFYTDYIYYLGACYPDSVVSFSRSFVEVKSKTTYGTKESLHFQLEIDDIIKIESQWSARLETGTISIFFISKRMTHDVTVDSASVSGIHELMFPAVDPDWYEKKEAVESLDIKYKALWNTLLDIGMEKCSTLPNWEAMFTGSYIPSVDKPFDEVIYPKGDPDAVSLSKRDIDLLQPDTFVNDTIIDFYIKYLKNRQNEEEKVKFHFFNSFFFRKLADMDKDPSSAFDGKAAFQRVRKWTRKVNLLEKDFIFIPVNYNYHWSLIVICYFGDVARITGVDDKLVRVPCILHMDSIRGTHMCLKDLMQSYLLEEWKERQEETCEDLYSKFRNLKFVSLELPQQQNLYDCGLFLLHYVELFLEEVPADFNVHKITSSSNFLQADWFPPTEASMKRARIERLIYELLDTYSEECHLSSESDANHSPNASVTANYNENEHGIEMTLLPARCMSNIQCIRNPVLSLKHIHEPEYVLGPFNDVHSEAIEKRASFNDIRRPVTQNKEEVGVGELVHTGLAAPSFEHVDGLIPGATVFPYSLREFRLEPDHEAMLEDADLSPATSSSDSDDALEVEADEKCQLFEATNSDDELDKLNCVLSENIECSASVSRELVRESESCSHVEISDRKDGSLVFKNLLELYEETNQIQGDGTSSREILPCCLPVASGDTLDATDCVSPYRAVDSTDPTHTPALALPISVINGVDGVSLSEACEFHVAKRMRVSHLDQSEKLTCDLSNDLHL